MATRSERCAAWFGSDEDEAVLWWTVALLGFLDLLPRPAALMVPHRLPVEHSFSATVTAPNVFSFQTAVCIVSLIYCLAQQPIKCKKELRTSAAQICLVNIAD